MIITLFSKLNTILNRFIALKTVFFAFDGPASFPKMKMQRQRRELRIRKRSESENPTLNRCLLTPGTSTMDQCKEAILYYCSQRLQNKKYEKVEFIISGADAAGEGEIKIISWIYENSRFHDSTDRYLIITSDADLLFLSLGTLNENIYMLHSTSDLCFFSTGEFYSEVKKQTSKFTLSIMRDFIFVS